MNPEDAEQRFYSLRDGREWELSRRDVAGLLAPLGVTDAMLVSMTAVGILSPRTIVGGGPRQRVVYTPNEVQRAFVAKMVMDLQSESDWLGVSKRFEHEMQNGMGELFFSTGEGQWTILQLHNMLIQSSLQAMDGEASWL